MSTLGGLIGNESAVLELKVENRTPSRFVVEDAALETKGKSYRWRMAGDGAEEWRSADAGATARINLFFRLDGPIYNVYGDSVDLVVNYRLGSKRDVLRITFKRQS